MDHELSEAGRLGLTRRRGRVETYVPSEDPCLSGKHSVVLYGGVDPVRGVGPRSTPLSDRTLCEYPRRTETRVHEEVPSPEKPVGILNTCLARKEPTSGVGDVGGTQTVQALPGLVSVS